MEFVLGYTEGGTRWAGLPYNSTEYGREMIRCGFDDTLPDTRLGFIDFNGIVYMPRSHLIDQSASIR